MLPMIEASMVGMEAIKVCIVDGLYRLLLEAWYLVVPVIVVQMDSELGNHGLLSGIRNCFKS